MKSITKEQLNNDSECILIDIRSPKDYQEGHIPGATNLFFYSPDYKDTIKSLDKDKRYVLYCNTECRVNEAFTDLKAEGIKDISILEGGYLGWVGEDEWGDKCCTLC